MLQSMGLQRVGHDGVTELNVCVCVCVCVCIQKAERLSKEAITVKGEIRGKDRCQL